LAVAGIAAMPPKKNPLGLNPLQLKTLTLFQALAHLPEHGEPAGQSGGVRIRDLPHPHGDHFHLGPHQVVLSRDATGLANPAAWAALERKGLIVGQFPHALVLTAEGLAYETGLAGTILHGSDHG